MSVRGEGRSGGEPMNAMRLRFLSRIIVVVLVVVVGAIIIIHGNASATSPKSSSGSSLVGLDLGEASAPAFTLDDQSGASFALASAQGHPVVLTFVDSSCQRECAALMTKLHQAAGQLGGQASRVRWIAVSVNPSSDTPATASAFVAGHGMPGLRYLLGSQAQLAPVWQAYHIAVTPQSDGSIAYTDAVYVLDSQGRERVYLDHTFTPGMLATDLRALLAGA